MTALVAGYILGHYGKMLEQQVSAGWNHYSVLVQVHNSTKGKKILTMPTLT